MKSIGVDPAINRVHRVSKPKPAENKATTATRQVIVQFKDNTSKKQVIKARSKLRESHRHISPSRKRNCLQRQGYSRRTRR